MLPRYYKPYILHNNFWEMNADYYSYEYQSKYKQHHLGFLIYDEI